jgi:fatty-acyl-CoA synthase
LARLKPEVAICTGDSLYDIKEKQGYAPFGVEMKVTDDDERRTSDGTARPLAG